MGHDLTCFISALGHWILVATIHQLSLSFTESFTGVSLSMDGNPDLLDLGFCLFVCELDF